MGSDLMVFWEKKFFFYFFLINSHHFEMFHLDSSCSCGICREVIGHWMLQHQQTQPVAFATFPGQ
jgi:hypothetical protein